MMQAYWCENVFRPCNDAHDRFCTCSGFVSSSRCGSDHGSEWTRLLLVPCHLIASDQARLVDFLSTAGEQEEQRWWSF